MGLITEDETKYRGQFVEWCRASFLQLNTKETKEITFDLNVRRRTHQQVAINGDCTEVVNEYKYILGQ